MRLQSASVFGLLLALVGCAGARHKGAAEPALDRPVRMPFSLARPVREALEAANQDQPADRRWRVMGIHESAGLYVEHYRLEGGPTLVLIPDPSAQLLRYETFVPHGYCDLLGASEGLAGALATPYASEEARALDNLGVSVESRVGCTLSARSLELGASEPALLEKVAKHEAERTTKAEGRALDKRPPSDWEGLELSLLRAYLSSGAGVAPLPADAYRGLLTVRRALVVLSGPLDRAQALTAIGAAYASVEGPDAIEIKQLGPPQVQGPIKLDVPGGPSVLVVYRVAEPSLEDRMALDAIAHVLADGPASRLGKLFGSEGATARARAVTTPAGSELQLFLTLADVASATAAVDRVRAEIGAIGRGETTGLELERARRGMYFQWLSALASLVERGPLVAEALLLKHNLDDLALAVDAAPELEERSVRRTAATFLSSVRPFVVLGRPKAEKGGKP